ncbi:putative NBD/HSP70 family sugar kinase [Conyzicola lurida]|uniref:Putative NBD/HSP70 family sugar kinase n=1 Tax=Conyzicola lurida TaxID=1172621 RepID=A0A841AR93_9MICO|nr:ROK family transcriptional regulator [Conyzicola lurida]MBB5843939.1 putative NBD/HSP70 family sugar kinase [Conyzicola lurida]
MTIETASVAGPARQLAREVLIHGPISRAELGQRLGLSPASLTRLSKPFIDRGLFVDAPGSNDGALGRPARPLDVLVDSQRFIGVKITADQVFGVATDLRATPLASAVVDLDGEDRHTPERVIAAIADLVADLGGVDGITSVGVTLGGKVVRSSVADRAPFLGWRGVDLGTLVGDALGVPVIVENDVTALTAAEQWFGEAKGIDNFAVVTIGAGVGYGLVIHGHPVVTSDTGLGLGGHFPLDPTGPLCFEGHRGCSTAMLSIPSMCASARGGLGRDVGYDELLDLAIAGDPVATAVVDAAARALGRLIAASANLAMVETVVLSGEGIALADAKLDLVVATLRADRDPEATPVRIIVDRAGFSAWARGAAAVAIQASFV